MKSCVCMWSAFYDPIDVKPVLPCLLCAQNLTALYFLMHCVILSEEIST